METTFIILSVFASFFWLFQLISSIFEHTSKELVLDHTPQVSVVVPIFNEDLTRIKDTLASILAQKNIILEVIVVDDGSNVPVVIQDDQIQLVRLDQNEGKRVAQIHGVEKAKYDWIVTVDSDTILDEMAIYNLYSKVIQKKADAGTGTVRLINESKNWLTRITACMYWFSFHQERASQSFLNTVICCSGALAIYKKDTILKDKELYINQKFFGLNCQAGDDRHLTNIFIMNGKNVCWARKSVARTYSPPTLSQFFKQQLRWTRSYVSAFYFILSHPTKWNWRFWFFTLKLNFKYFYQLSVCTGVLLMTATTASVSPLLLLVASIIFISAIKSCIAYLYSFEAKYFWTIPYGLFAFFVWNWILFYGLVTPWKITWLTRKNEV